MRRFERSWSSSSFFQHSAGLNEQAAVDGFVGHAQALVIRILGLQPSGNLLGRPVQDQFTRNDVPQLAVAGKEALLRSQGRVPSSTIRIKGAIGRTATMARNGHARLTVEAARSSRRAISRSGESEAIPREMSSRSASVSASRERRRAAGGMPPRGNNTERMQLCGLSKARPISCSDCPAFHRLQTSRFSIAESPNRCPALMPTPPLHSRLTSDGVASTRRMHRVYQAADATSSKNRFTLLILKSPADVPKRTINQFCLRQA